MLLYMSCVRLLVFVDLDDVDFCLLMYNRKVLGEVILDWIINVDGDGDDVDYDDVDDNDSNTKQRRRPTTPMNF